MSYRSRRSSKRFVQKSRRNFIITVIIVIALLYVTLQWILPGFIGGLGFVTGILKPSHKTDTQISENASLAPPVLNITYEATSTAQINISGYGTANSKVRLYLDNDQKETIDVKDDGSFTFENIDLNLGTNEISATSIDDKDKESLPSKVFKIIYDNEKPTLEISEPEDNKKIQGEDKKVRLAGKTEVGAHLFINDIQVVVNNEGNFSTERALNDGDNDFNIKAMDAAGNSTEISRRVNYSP